MAGTFNDTNEGSYTKRFDYDGSGNILYAGLAAPGTASSAAAWAIRRYTYVGANLVLVDWAGSNNSLVNVWNDRAALQYG